MTPAKTCNHRTLRFSHSRIEELISASSVRRVAVGAQQQRNVQVRFTAANSKRDLHNRVQSFHAASGEVARDVKRQAMRSFRERCTFRQQLAASSVLIGLRRSNQHPFAGRFLTLQAHRHTRSGFALGRIQNVRRNLTHPVIHFLSRMCMICRCSSAASCSSVASSLCSRRRRISRISLADFPVAQTIKIHPNFCSYSRLPHFSAIFTASSAVSGLFSFFVRPTVGISPTYFFAPVSPLLG